MKRGALLLFALIPVFAYAQLTKGSIFLGGTLSSSTYGSAGAQYSSSTVKDNNFSISPSLGFLLNEKFSMGVSLGYSTSLRENKSDYFTGSGLVTITTKYTNNSYSTGFFTRNFFKLSEQFYFALQSQVTFSRGTLKSEQNPASFFYPFLSEQPTYSVGLNVRPMFIFFPSPKWGIEASVGSAGYTYFRNLPDVSHSSTSGLSAGSFSFGAAYYFLKK